MMHCNQVTEISFLNNVKKKYLMPSDVKGQEKIVLSFLNSFKEI